VIHKILVENFFSVSERQEVNFAVPANVPEHSCFRPSRSTDANRLPLVIGVFGPNASGKSTFLRAITAAAWFAQHSFSIGPNAQLLLFQSYAHSDWWERPTKIAVEFDSQLVEGAPSSLFRYELHVGNTAATPGKDVVFEALSYAPKGKFRRVFERSGQKCVFGKEYGISESDSRVSSIRPNASVISTLAQLNHKISVDLIRWLGALQSNIYGIDKQQSAMAQVLTYYAQHPKYLAALNRELNRLDLGLEEMKILPGTPSPIALFKHVGLERDIFLLQESMGTRRFIEIFPMIQYVLDLGGVAVIDELDTDIHPLIVPEIFRWFYSRERNPNRAQLFFSAHNPAILDEMEKEQVFFTEKLGGKSTRIYGASDIKGLRREPRLMKKYLSGELGAVPHIG
jgi:hypothetical protein